jgi:hypothetical protein
LWSLTVIVKGARRSERYGINWHSALRIKKLQGIRLS